MRNNESTLDRGRRVLNGAARRSVILIVALLSVVPARLLAQQLPKRPVTDSATKAAAADTSRTRIKIGKEPVTHVTVSGGDVTTLGFTRQALDSAVAAERAAGDMREQYAREAQRRIDEIEMENRVRRAVNRAIGDAIAHRERERRDSVIHAGQAAQAAALTLERQLSRGFYVGIAGGMSSPQGDLRSGYTGGWNVTMPVGWDHDDSPIGLRGDFSVNQLGATHIDEVLATHAGTDLTVWSLNADLKLRKHAPSSTSRTHIYAIGGVGMHSVTKGVYGVTGPNAGKERSFGDAGTSFGWNAGAGLSAPWGRSEVFIEARYVHIKSDLSYRSTGGVGQYTSFTPIVIGVQWF